MAYAMAHLRTDAQPFVVAHDLSLGDLRMQTYQHVDLSLEAGKAHALCAEDKGGKTELMLTLAGRLRASSGKCSVDGHDVQTMAGMRAARKEASLAFFDGVNDVERVLRVHTIASAELGLAGRKSSREATRQFLSLWGLQDEWGSTIEDLPRFTYDVLGVALAMAHQPRLLLVQDIERDLTKHESAQMAQLLCDIAARDGVTVVCGVHDLELGMRFDSLTCITDATRAQQQAWREAHQAEEVA
jgi:ABC-type branched-subunit amino acid transport system ATPase component